LFAYPLSADKSQYNFKPEARGQFFPRHIQRAPTNPAAWTNMTLTTAFGKARAKQAGFFCSQLTAHWRKIVSRAYMVNYGRSGTIRMPLLSASNAPLKRKLKKSRQGLRDFTELGTQT